MRKELFVSKVKQRDNSEINFTVFVASSKDIKKWTGITRVGEEDKGHQRVLKETRLKAIKKFIRSDNNNTIPTSIILAFQPGTTNYESLSQRLDDCVEKNLTNEIEDKIDYGILTFDYDENAEEKKMPAFVVDGQHRLMGLAELEEDIPVLGVCRT